VTIYRVTVEREANARLVKNVWTYAYTGHTAALMLDSFVRYERPTTRHKFRPALGWYNNRRDRPYGVHDTTKNIPPDVAQEARETWVAHALANGVEGLRS
jgi:phage gp16-like protein